MNKKKMFFMILVLGVLVITLVFLFFPVSATCEYKGTPEVCTLENRVMPNWKLLFFKLTGVRTGY